jgi:hypothetical protein
MDKCSASKSAYEAEVAFELENVTDQLKDSKNVFIRE